MRLLRRRLCYCSCLTELAFYPAKSYKRASRKVESASIRLSDLPGLGREGRAYRTHIPYIEWTTSILGVYL